jgi:hypothetical protein
MHKEASPLAGKVVKIKSTVQHRQGIGGQDYRVEDWWDRLGQGSWMMCDGNPACLIYAMRSGLRVPSLPLDDEVLYGKVGAFGHLVHISEIEVKNEG